MGKVPPNVRILLPCDGAILDPSDNRWLLKNPWGVRQLPLGTRFPIRAKNIWVYAQFAEGIGEFELVVEIRQLLDSGGQRFVGNSNAETIDFPSSERLLIRDTAFHLTKVPFRESGLYEFRALADGLELVGMRSVIRVLDRA